MDQLRRRIAIIVLAMLITLSGGTLGFVLIDHYPVFDAFYMTLITVTTVGYAEIQPLSRAGRVFNSFLILFGVIIMLLAIGAMTQMVIALELNQFFGKRRVKSMIDKLEGHIILCGYGRVGRGAAEELRLLGVPFVIVDKNEDIVERAMQAGMLAALADASRDETLLEVGIKRARGLIASLASDADNLFVILTARTLNPRVQLSARVAEESSELKLRRAGADFVFAPYNSTGHRMVQAIVKPHVQQFLDVTTRNMGLNVGIEQVQVIEGSAFAGKTLAEIHMRRDTGVIVLAIRKQDGQMFFNPPAESKISSGDHLIAMGESQSLRRLEALLTEGARMMVLTAEEIREVDRLTIAGGVPSLALMENAAHRVEEALAQQFDPLQKQFVVVLCGKGNNGGDGLALARLLSDKVARLHVVMAAAPEELSGDAAVNYRRLCDETRVVPAREIPQKLRERREVTVVVDALLGTGVKGPAQGRILDLIRATREFPEAKVVAVDLPSGLGGGGECVRADTTVTFTAPKAEHYLAEGAEECVGRLVVAQIGCPPQLVVSKLEVSDPRDFAPLFRPRKRDSNKGDFGHVLIVGGSPGKSGSVSMAGLAALRMGAGLVTVTSRDASHFAPELMTETVEDFSLEKKTVVAVGPGLGLHRDLLAGLMRDPTVPMVIDADGLNSIAGTDFRGRGADTILTPHPGEMARLLGRPVGDRVQAARGFAEERNVCLVLKGNRTLIGLPDGRVFINLSGSPAMATGGTGDVLTGMISGLVAQFPNQIELAVRAAVWLHGRSGELGAEELTEQCLIATDLLRFLPRAIQEIG